MQYVYGVNPRTGAVELGYNVMGHWMPYKPPTTQTKTVTQPLVAADRDYQNSSPAPIIPQNMIPQGLQVYGAGNQATAYQRPTAPTAPIGTGFRPQFDPNFMNQILAQRMGGQTARPPAAPTLTPGASNTYGGYGGIGGLAALRGISVGNVGGNVGGTGNAGI